ncbi:hypothetical protein ABV838_004635 [Escherichia coli]|nr:hypothetical protein [Escherichia coli]EJN6044734.1 hypothetical protein [Salmonella enterica]EET6213117.1 hypothetical protein [Escherichia coli]EGT7915940.1 hypothetical protein [Escherichia coli]EGZ3453714.1 hypothetical protein [Escherichia coli]EJE7500433.1 hypothetical protein [Escherichia coli]
MAISDAIAIINLAVLWCGVAYIAGVTAIDNLEEKMIDKYKKIVDNLTNA